jgi:hypothetical protein
MAQTVAPAQWIVVDGGSSDCSRSVTRELSLGKAAVELVSLERSSVDPVRGGPVVQALHNGFANVRSGTSVVAKVDADVSFGPEYFESLLDELEQDPRLGIVSGSRYELVNERWTEQPVTGSSVNAQCRAYRATCLQEILPFEERSGWDTIDEIEANLLGWRTRTLRNVCFRHHRPIGARDESRWKTWYAEGKTCHYLHYRPTYTCVRALYRARRDIAALGLPLGFVAATVRRQTRHPMADVRRFVREEQRLRHLATRAAEALGRRPLAEYWR